MKRTILLIVTAVLLLSVALNALAVTVYGPGVYVTLASGTKASTSAEPSVAFSYVDIEGVGPFIYWIENRTKTGQVTGDYYLDDDASGTKRVYYMAEARADGKVVAGDRYALSGKSGSGQAADDYCTVNYSRFVP